MKLVLSKTTLMHMRSSLCQLEAEGLLSGSFPRILWLENTESEPTKNLPKQNASMEAKNEHFDKVLGKFVDYHVFHLGVTVNDKVQREAIIIMASL